MKRPKLLQDQGHALAIGLVLTALGGYCLYDAYEGRGAKKPFLMKWVTGGWS